MTKYIVSWVEGKGIGRRRSFNYMLVSTAREQVKYLENRTGVRHIKLFKEIK